MTQPSSEQREDYPVVEEGEWIRPPLDELFGMQCCDCGLKHDLEFSIQDDRVIFRAFRSDGQNDG